MAEEKILDRVAKLLERANHKNTDAPERDVCLRMADKLMMQHQIDEAMLAARSVGKEVRRNPIVADAVFVSSKDEFFSVLAKVSSEFSRLCKVRLIVSQGYARDENNRLIYDSDSSIVEKNSLKICGFPDDVEYFRMLWTGAFLVFSSKLSPRWDNSETLAWNIRQQKESGVKWGSIYDIAKANGWSGYRMPGKVNVNTPVRGQPFATPSFSNEDLSMPMLPISVDRCPADKGYFKKLYELQCKLDGVEATNHTQRNAAYRESYAWGFLAEIQQRCIEMRRVRDQHVASSGGAEIALRDGWQIVSDFFRNMFPTQESLNTSGPRHGTETAGAAAGHLAGRNVDLLGGRNRMGGEKRALEG